VPERGRSRTIRTGRVIRLFTSSREVRVCLFFLMVAAVAAYVWFCVLDHGAGEGFHLTARFKGVEGLIVGAPVHMAGIKIGRVKEIRFEPVNNVAVVLMQIRNQYRNSIPADSQVRLKKKGLMGDKYVVIVPGRPDAAKLKADDEIKTVF